MRSLLAVLGALLLTMTAVGGAAAGAFKESDHVRDLGCDGVATPAGTAFFYASTSDLFGTDAFLDVWDDTDQLVWTRDFDRPAAVTFGPTSAQATIPLLPSGEALVQASLEPAGDISFTDAGKDGNSRYRTTVIGTGYAATGTLTLPGGGPIAFGPDGCNASDVRIQNFFSQPHASVRSFSSTNGSCELTNNDGDTATVFMAIEDDATLFLDAFVRDSGGDEVGASGVGDIVAGSVAMTLDEFDPETGEPTAAEGTAQVSLTESGDDFSYVLRSSNGAQRVTGSLVDVGGAIATSVGSFNLDPCVIAALRIKEHTTPSNGPKPGGKRPANDLPTGAKTLRVGSKASVSTKGAQVPSEAAYPCMVVEDFDGTLITIPVEHTVWYRVAGTGRPITVDTAGSSFDTVVAVYGGAPDAGATVACLDDTPLQPFGRTLQASVTFSSVVGTTYWIQVGGINEDVFGNDPHVPYGNLRVAIR